MKTVMQILGVMLLAACQARQLDANSSIAEGCGAWAKGDRLSADLTTSTPTRDVLNASLVETIRDCFQMRDYDGEKVHFPAYQTRRMPSGETVVTFDTDVMDVQLGVLISTDSRLVEAGWTSLNY